MRIHTRENIRLRSDSGHHMLVDIGPGTRGGWRAEISLLAEGGQRWLAVGHFQGRNLDALRTRSVDLAADILAAAACPAGGFF